MFARTSSSCSFFTTSPRQSHSSKVHGETKSTFSAAVTKRRGGWFLFRRGLWRNGFAAAKPFLQSPRRNKIHLLGGGHEAAQRNVMHMCASSARFHAAAQCWNATAKCR